MKFYKIFKEWLTGNEKILYSDSGQRYIKKKGRGPFVRYYNFRFDTWEPEFQFHDRKCEFVMRTRDNINYHQIGKWTKVSN